MAGDTGNPPSLMRLKDLLELDCDSCSAAGFRCYPRRLGESSPTPLVSSFCRSPAPSLRRSTKLSHISRSLSRRLRGSFRWLRSNGDYNEEEVLGEDAAVRGCGGCGSEQGTSPSESSDSSGTSSSTTRRSSRRSDESDSDFSTSASESMHAAVATARDDHEHEDDAMMKRGAREEEEEEGSSSGSSEADDKEEELSPVAIMGFPCFDDDDECSPASGDRLLPRLQGAAAGGGRKAHKIRRFGSRLDELGLVVDLDARLADDDDVPARQLQRHGKGETAPPRPTSTSMHRGDAPDASNGLLVLLMDTVSAGADVVSERLLLDFLVEMKVLERRRSERAGLPAPAGPLLPPRKAERLGGDGEVLAAARGWLLDGAGAKRWGLEDVLRGGEAVISEMERGRRWMQVGEEQREVGTVVAGVLADQLVDEVVMDLLV